MQIKYYLNIHVLFAYADIFYEKEAIQILNRSKKRKGIVLLSYKHWKKILEKRFTNPFVRFRNTCIK